MFQPRLYAGKFQPRHYAGKKTHRTPKNLYIVNLAIAGLSMCGICIPPTLSQCLYGGEWFLGRFACKLVPTMQGRMLVQTTPLYRIIDGSLYCSTNFVTLRLQYCARALLQPCSNVHRVLLQYCADWVTIQCYVCLAKRTIEYYNDYVRKYQERGDSIGKRKEGQHKEKSYNIVQGQ